MTTTAKSKPTAKKTIVYRGGHERVSVPGIGSFERNEPTSVTAEQHALLLLSPGWEDGAKAKS